jgi:hypothetical protein
MRSCSLCVLHFNFWTSLLIFMKLCLIENEHYNIGIENEHYNIGGVWPQPRVRVSFRTDCTLQILLMNHIYIPVLKTCSVFRNSSAWTINVSFQFKELKRTQYTTYKGQICNIEHNNDTSEYSTLIFSSSHSFPKIKFVGSKLRTL